MRIELSERQQRAVAAAITIVAAGVIIAAIGLLLWGLASFLSAFSQVFLPLAVAAVAALVLRPCYLWLEKRLPMPLALAALFLSVLIPFVAFTWFFGAIIFDQLTDLVSRAPELWRQALAFVQERLPRVREFLAENPLGQQLSEAAAGQEEALVSGLRSFGVKALAAGAGLLKGIGVLLNWVVLPVYLAFFLMFDLRRARNIDRHLPFLKEETRNDLIYLAREFVNIIVAFFRGQLIIALLQGALFALGFSLVGLRYGLVLGLLLGLLNIIPYLGSLVGLGICLPLAFLQQGGGASTLVGVLVVFCLVQLIEGYVLTPKVMGSRTGLHPVAVIVSVFFWGSALGGIMGMILAIPLTAFLVVFWRLARDKYIGELV